MSEQRFTISVPTVGGFLARECNSATCRRHFRVNTASIKPRMYCPYCGALFSNDQLHTQAQVGYMKEVALEQAKEYVYGEMDKMFGKLANSTRGNKFITIKHTPRRYQARPVSPRPSFQKVDTQLDCPGCGVKFQVRGVFGYCPGCRLENMMIYDANLVIIEREIAASTDKTRALRHAYDDLVSTFELHCVKKAPQSEDRPRSFQELFAVRQFFKTQRGIDIFDRLSVEQLLCLRRVFQKRHAYQHSEGRITEQYIKKVPEDSALLGAHATLSLEEFRQAALVMKDVFLRLY